jgi:hypothetical protein
MESGFEGRNRTKGEEARKSKKASTKQQNIHPKTAVKHFLESLLH